MSKEVEGQLATGEGLESQKPVLDAESLAKKLEELEQTNKRLLEESKRYKKTAKEIESEKERLEREKAEKDGNAQKLLEMERERAKKLSDEFSGLRKKTMEANVRSAFSKYASEVQSIDMLMRVPEFAYILDEGKDEDNLTVASDAVQRYVDAVLEAHPYLRKTSTPSTFNKPPQTPIGKKKSLADMTADEIRELYKKRG